MVCIVEILWADRSFSAKILDGIQIRNISYIGSGRFCWKTRAKGNQFKKGSRRVNIVNLYRVLDDCVDDIYGFDDDINYGIV